MNDTAVTVSQDLHLEMARSLQEPLDEDRPVAEGQMGLLLCLVQLCGQFTS